MIASDMICHLQLRTSSSLTRYLMWCHLVITFEIFPAYLQLLKGIRKASPHKWLMSRFQSLTSQLIVDRS